MAGPQLPTHCHWHQTPGSGNYGICRLLASNISPSLSLSSLPFIDMLSLAPCRHWSGNYGICRLQDANPVFFHLSSLPFTDMSSLAPDRRVRSLSYCRLKCPTFLTSLSLPSLSKTSHYCARAQGQVAVVLQAHFSSFLTSLHFTDMLSPAPDNAGMADCSCPASLSLPSISQTCCHWHQTTLVWQTAVVQHLFLFPPFHRHVVTGTRQRWYGRLQLSSISFSSLHCTDMLSLTPDHRVR